MGGSLQGRAEIERRHAEIFTTIFARSRVVVTTRKVRMLGATVALAETDYELRDYDRFRRGSKPPTPTAPSVRASSTYASSQPMAGASSQLRTPRSYYRARLWRIESPDTPEPHDR